MQLKYIALLLLIVCFSSNIVAKTPDWVKKRPINNMNYIGISFASKTNPNYMEIAKKQAISDLISEIKVEIQSESFLHTVEKNEQVSNYFKNTIQMRSQQELQDFQLEDSWEDKNYYWLYYKLSKLDYEEFVARRRAKATNEGYEYWIKGLSAQKSGDIPTAISMYIKGLNGIEPCANEELRHEHNGDIVDVAVELYNSLKQVFSDIEIDLSKDVLTMKPFLANSEEIVISVTQKKVPLKNLKLKIAFITGSGRLSSNNTTNTQGKLDLNISSITSKATRQEVLVTIDVSQFYSRENEFYQSILKIFAANTPRKIINLNIEQLEKKAYIEVFGEGNESLGKSIKSLLTNKHFVITTDPESADITISVKSSIKKGGIVKGDMYNFNEYFTSVNIQFKEKETSRSLLDYSLNDHRSLSSVNSSETTAHNLAVREALKQITKEINKQLENLSINN